jgi:hypothetical protein
VHEVERFALRKLIIGIEDMNLADYPSALQRESCVRTDPAAAADN